MTTPGTTFARRVFLGAGIYGLIALLPQYVLERKNGADFPPAITHSEYYYGFIGVAVAWQLVFLVMSRDPARYRPIMLAAVVEKAAFAIPAVLLYSLGRLSLSMLGAGLIDAVLGVLFLVAWRRTADAPDAFAASRSAAPATSA